MKRRLFLAGSLLAVTACADRQPMTPERLAQMDEAARLKYFAEVRAARRQAAADREAELDAALLRLKLARWRR